MFKFLLTFDIYNFILVTFPGNQSIPYEDCKLRCSSQFDGLPSVVDRWNNLLWNSPTVGPIGDSLTTLPRKVSVGRLDRFDMDHIMWSIRYAYTIGPVWYRGLCASPIGQTDQKIIQSKHFITMNRLFQLIIAEDLNEDTKILMEKCFMLKLNLISRMVCGSQVL